MTGLKASAEGDGSGILGVLEIELSDFAEPLADASTAEEAAADTFKR